MSNEFLIPTTGAMTNVRSKKKNGNSRERVGAIENLLALHRDMSRKLLKDATESGTLLLYVDYIQHHAGMNQLDH